MLIVDSVIKKKSISVLVEMSNGKSIKGEVFMGASQRLQDLINGERSFLPLKIHDEKEASLLLLNKRYIVSFQEIK